MFPSNPKCTPTIFLSLALLLAATPAFAQEKKVKAPAAPKVAPAAKNEAKAAPSAEAKVVPAAKVEAKGATTAEAKESAKVAPSEGKEPKVDFNAADVWNVDIFDKADHKVLVIQDRKYTKAGKFELGLHGGSFSFSPWYNTYSYGGQLGYHFTEYLGLEVFGNQSSSSLSADGKQVQDFLTNSGFSSTKEFHKPKIFAGTMVTWSPIYGKFAFFRASIIHFDIFGQIGPSFTSYSSNSTGRTEKAYGLATGLGMRVFLSKTFNLRLDVRNDLYNAKFAPVSNNSGTTVTDSKTLLRSAFQYSLGLSMLLGSGKVANQED